MLLRGMELFSFAALFTEDFILFNIIIYRLYYEVRKNITKIALGISTTHLEDVKFSKICDLYES